MKQCTSPHNSKKNFEPKLKIHDVTEILVKNTELKN